MIKQMQRGTPILTIVFMEEKKRVFVSKVVEVFKDERWGFEKIFPISAHGLKSNDGFDMKPLENVDDNVKW